MLALGIATTTSIFSLFDALLWRPLPLSGADRIMQVMLVRANGPTPQVAEPHYVFWRTHSTVFESLTGLEYLEMVAALYAIPEAAARARIEQFIPDARS